MIKQLYGMFSDNKSMPDVITEGDSFDEASGLLSIAG